MRRSLVSVWLIAATIRFSSVEAQPFCPGITPWVFDDVQASDPFCGSITWMATSSVTLGCQTIDADHRLYCPDDFVTRKQMAAFMFRLGVENAFLDGGNAFGAAAVLGTRDNNDLNLVVGNARVVRYAPNNVSPNVIAGREVAPQSRTRE